jgi:hypothetical protein
MAKNHKRYQRQLDVGSIISLFLLALVAAIVACGFVGIKNAHVERGDVRRTLEKKIKLMEKEVDSIDLRISALCDRRVLASSLRQHESKLIPIMRSEELHGLPAALPQSLALAKGQESKKHH